MTATPLRAASQSILTVAQVRAGDCPCIGANSPDDDTVQTLINKASDMIAIVTGGGISGRQSVIARPCRSADYLCAPCPCCDLDAIPIGDADSRPVITEVLVDGVAIDEAYYWLHWNRVMWMLARRPNAALNETRPPDWPSWQHRWAAHTDTDTFAIRFTQGIHVDDLVIQDAALEVVCDLANASPVRANAIEGATSVNLGGSNVVRDPNRLSTSDDTRLKRIANGELGPMCRKMMGIFAPGGRSRSMVWAPELTFGWELNLEIDMTP